MNKFWTIVSAFIDLVIGTGGGFLLTTLLQSEYSSIEKWALGIFLLIVAFILFVMNALFFSILYDKFYLIRWCVPKKYIEGTWVQIIDDNNLHAMPPTKYTIITIKLENNIHTVKVNTYNQQGIEMVSIKIPYTKFYVEDGKLEYLYKFRSREFSDNKHWIAMAELEFTTTTKKRRFNKYLGIINSNLPRENEIRVKAFKHSRKIKLDNGKKIRIDEQSIKKPEVRKHIDEYIKKIF